MTVNVNGMLYILLDLVGNIRKYIWNKRDRCRTEGYKTDFKLMVAQQSGKGPNLEVVKWW